MGQTIGGEAMSACGQEDFEHLLEAGSAQVAGNQ
jgi:uncharacterized protein YacL (UPF0231 family)